MLRLMRSMNPATGETIAEYEPYASEEVDRRLLRAVGAAARWSLSPFGERAALLRALAATLRDRRDPLATLAVLEMGKPIRQAEAEVEKCAWVCDWAAAHGEALLAPVPAGVDGAKSFVRFDPLGVLLAIMPWNFPYWQVFRCAVPALAAGNAVVLKHASNVCGCALAIGDVFRAAGAPAGLFDVLLLPAAAVGAVIADPMIAAVSLTGSEAAGREVGAAAGRALKPAVLELGGSDAFIVLADADVGAVVEQAAKARLQNNGQSCIAAKRFIVAAPIAEQFESALAARFAAVKTGNPLDPEVELGPLARVDLRDDLHAQLEKSVAAGARVLAGGGALPGAGAFYRATVLAGVKPGMAAFDEETFGPLAAITRARDEDDAITLANASRYGLGASVWTGDPERGERLAARIEAGAVFVNGIVASDPRMPFGGIKASGYGRELAEEGLKSFVNVKAVRVDASARSGSRQRVVAE